MAGFFSKLKNKISGKEKKSRTAAQRFTDNYESLDNDADRADSLIEGSLYAAHDGNFTSIRDQGHMNTALADVTSHISDGLLSTLIEKKNRAARAMEAKYLQAEKEYKALGWDDAKADMQARMDVAFSKEAQTDSAIYTFVIGCPQWDDDWKKKVLNGVSSLTHYEDITQTSREKYDAVLGAGRFDAETARSQTALNESLDAMEIGDAKKTSDTKKARMAELDLNNFEGDTSLCESMQRQMGSAGYATTRDVAVSKMLDNVTPQMLEDPEFVAQLNKLVGGGMADMVSERMGQSKGKIDKLLAFRGNAGATQNAKRLAEMYLGDSPAQMIDEQMNAAPGQVGMANGLHGMNEILHLTQGGDNTRGLLGEISQGMNGQGFSDEERSAAMMNHLILRNVSPHFAMSPERSQKQRGVDIQKAVNKPDEFYDPEFMHQFNSSLSDDVGERADHQVSARNPYNLARPQISDRKPAAKKKWYQFWK